MCQTSGGFHSEEFVDEQGPVQLIEPLQLPKSALAFVVIFGEELHVPMSALLSETALADDWLRPEEDAAWAHLHPDSSSYTKLSEDVS